MDVSFCTEQGRFNYRVCAVLIHDGRLLAMRDDRSPYYYLPGGRVQLHETAEDAVLRELREELDISAAIERPLWVNQGFFTEDVTGERFHELCVYYLIDPSGTDLLTRGESFRTEENGRVHSFYWLSFEQVKQAYLYPLFIKQQLEHLPGSLTIIANYD